jgi:hypothetical protein
MVLYELTDRQREYSQELGEFLQIMFDQAFIEMMSYAAFARPPGA